jgi:hypothetical protein
MDFSPLVRRSLYPLLVVSQTLPLIAIAPLFIIWFGFDLLPKVFESTDVTGVLTKEAAEAMGLDGGEGKIKVESKDDMKKRGVKSPNKADAFCLSLAGGDFAMHQRRHEVAVTNYDPFSVHTDDYESHVRGLGRRQGIASGVTDYDPFR